MDPEFILGILALAMFGFAGWIVALLAAWTWTRSHESERAAWWRLMLPVFVGALVIAFLLGWALQEASPADEQVGPIVCVLAVLATSVVVRAARRALGTLRAGHPPCSSLCTVGLLKPRIVVSAGFRAVLSRRAFEAALAHERVHVRRRDPLRIWLAQIAADVQWPSPGTRRRLSAWLEALEAERDDQALADGAAGDDLAEAILAAARLHRDLRAAPCAYAGGGSSEGIAWRVRRLLSTPDPSGTSAPVRLAWLAPAACVVLLTSALWLGVFCGDAVVRSLPGITP